MHLPGSPSFSVGRGIRALETSKYWGNLHIIIRAATKSACLVSDDENAFFFFYLGKKTFVEPHNGSFICNLFNKLHHKW